ncbi:MAG: metalloregulator ArsR/SmtB family transcription factor [Thermodesulfobacteriota bacterium]
MKDFIRVMKALADPNRVRVIKLLEEDRALCVCEIQALLGLAQSTVSKHLKILEDAGLVERQRQGSWIIYSLCRQADNPYRAVILREIKGWLNDDQELCDMRQRLPEVACLRQDGEISSLKKAAGPDV